jgi:transcriptional regulator GlxA family with amidase domain
VIFLSGNSSIEDKLEGFASGGVDYICKPFSSEEVLARVFVHFKYGKLPEPGDDQADRYSLPGQFALQESSRNNQILASAIEILSSPDLQWEGIIKLSRQLGVNEKKLTEIFKNQFGMTVNEYHITQRLEIARARLASDRTQIQIIATEAGYQNASDFSRAFRSRYGLGPREYRQACSRCSLGGTPGEEST